MNIEICKYCCGGNINKIMIFREKCATKFIFYDKNKVINTCVFKTKNNKKYIDVYDLKNIEKNDKYLIKEREFLDSNKREYSVVTKKSFFQFMKRYNTCVDCKYKLEHDVNDLYKEGELLN